MFGGVGGVGINVGLLFQIKISSFGSIRQMENKQRANPSGTGIQL